MGRGMGSYNKTEASVSQGAYAKRKFEDVIKEVGRYPEKDGAPQSSFVRFTRALLTLEVGDCVVLPQGCSEESTSGYIVRVLYLATGKRFSRNRVGDNLCVVRKL